MRQFYDFERRKEAHGKIGKKENADLTKEKR